MNTKIALLVLYNHKYDKNIEKIKELYKGKFSSVFQLIPFYTGDDPTVIPVYGSSYYFQIFISQAYVKLKAEGYTHFFVVADDMVLNPDINENNIFELMGIGRSDAFISNLQPLQDIKYRLSWMSNAIKYKVKQKGLEIESVLPAREQVEEKFTAFNLPIPKVPINHFFKIQKYNDWRKTIYYGVKNFFTELPLLPRRKLNYPVIKGYSDILLMPSEYMDNFATYLGAFASSGLFVEFAIPTAMVMQVPLGHLKTCDNIKLKYGAMWSKSEIQSVSSMNKNSLGCLLNNFPKNKLFLHPIKLSKWGL